MSIIQSNGSEPPEYDITLLYCAALFLFFGFNYIMNFLRPITNLYIIYFDLDWAEFQFLEIFDVLNLIFGICLCALGALLIGIKTFNKPLLILGGSLLLFYSIINPSHFLIFGSLILIITGTPPIWLSVIPENLLGIYLSSWSILSLSNILLQLVGIYIAIRIILNSNPQRAIIQYIFFFCWVTGISGIILCLQSILILSLTASWSSLMILTYILRVGTWISMIILGITGLVFVRNWLKDQIQSHHLKFGQISLIAFAIMHLFISFSDFAMKTYIALMLNCVIAGIIILFAWKLPIYWNIDRINEPESSRP